MVQGKKKIVSTGTTTDYAGNYVYENNTLQFFNHAEGYVEPNGSSFNYVYQYKDHLEGGALRKQLVTVFSERARWRKARLSYHDTNGNGSITTSEIREEHNYYPFGLKHKGYNNVINGTDHPYGFGGKEEQDELGLGWIDITARNYDPALGRWMNLDPLASQMRRHSPYNYAFDNPIYFIDYDGMAPENIYELDKESGDISIKEYNDDETDTLVDADSGDTISSDVDKGLLNDGQNIKKNGLQSSNVSGAGKLATDISMSTSEEIVSVVYQNEAKEKYIEVRPLREVVLIEMKKVRLQQ